MIFIHDKVYAKVWKVTKTEKYIDLQITTSEKGAEGNYINSGWFGRAIGHAFNTLKDTLKEGDRIIITKSKMTNERYTDKDGNTRSSLKYIIIEASIEESKNGSETPVAPSPARTIQQEEADNPW